MWCVANAAHVKREREWRISGIGNFKSDEIFSFVFDKPCCLLTTCSYSTETRLPSLTLSLYLTFRLFRSPSPNITFQPSVLQFNKKQRWINNKNSKRKKRYQQLISRLGRPTNYYLLVSFLRETKSYCSRSQNGSQIRECEMSASPDPKNRYFWGLLVLLYLFWFK